MTSAELAALAPSDVVLQLSDRSICALTLFGEARGEPVEGRIAVANVIRNRVAANRAGFGGASYKAVCLKPAQFSCWLPRDPNLDLLIDAGRNLLGNVLPAAVLRECLWIADGVMTNSLLDNTKGSTHYLTAALYASHPPAWALAGAVRGRIGAHLFLKAD